MEAQYHYLAVWVGTDISTTENQAAPQGDSFLTSFEKART